MRFAGLLELNIQWRIRAISLALLTAIILVFTLSGKGSVSAESTSEALVEESAYPFSPTSRIESSTTESSQEIETTTTTAAVTTASTLPAIPLDQLEFEPIKNPSCAPAYNLAIDLNTLVRRAETDKETLATEINKFTPDESAKSWIANRVPQEMVDANNSEFIEMLLRQVLRRPPNDTEVETWTNKLDEETTRVDLTIELLRLNPYNKAVGPFCDFVADGGGGYEAAPGVVYQETGIEHVVFVDLEKVTKTYATAETTGLQLTPDFATENDLTVAINANWFTADGGLDGFVVSEGEFYGGDYNHDRKQQGDHDYTALFGFDKDHGVHTQWHGLTPGTPSAEIVTAISGHPSLTHKGELSSGYDFALGPESLDEYTLVQPNAHSAIGVSQNGKYLIFAAVDGRAGVGYSALQMAEMMKRLGAYESTMLDGGGSTSLVLNGTEVTDTNQGRKVLANVGVQTGSWFE